MRFIIGVLAICFLLGGNCSKSPQFLSAQLDHISSATMVNCDAYGVPPGGQPLQQRTCLVIANPFKPLLRAYDVSQVQFILSPIGYSPLAVRVDGLNSQLASYQNADKGYVFALDAGLSRITAISARNGAGGLQSFSGAAPRPFLQLDERPVRFFVANPKGDGNAQVLVTYRDGTIKTSEFDDVNSKFSDLQLQPTSLSGVEVLDSVYDATTGLIAFLVTAGGTNNIEVRKAIDTNPNPVTFTLNDVGNVKLAFGPINSSTSTAPHVLLMRQDLPKLRTIRLNSTTLAKEDDKEIELANVLAATYIPIGQKEPCCGGSKDWVSVASDDGFFYFLKSTELFSTETKVFNNNVSLAKTFNLPKDSLRGLTQLIGGDVQILTGSEAPKDRAVCPRQMFFVFSSGFVAGMCEGSVTGVTQIVSRDMAVGS